MVVVGFHLQAHLEYEVTGDKVLPKVGKHKVQQVKNHKVLEPHRKPTNRPGPTCAPPPAPAHSTKKCCVHFSYPSAACLQFAKLFSSEHMHAMMKTISAVRSGKEDNKDICLLFFFGQQ
jgi:hypothetical protein